MGGAAAAQSGCSPIEGRVGSRGGRGADALTRSPLVPPSSRGLLRPTALPDVSLLAASPAEPSPCRCGVVDFACAPGAPPPGLPAPLGLPPLPAPPPPPPSSAPAPLPPPASPAGPRALWHCSSHLAMLCAWHRLGAHQHLRRSLLPWSSSRPSLRISCSLRSAASSRLKSRLTLTPSVSATSATPTPGVALRNASYASQTAPRYASSCPSLPMTYGLPRGERRSTYSSTKPGSGCHAWGWWRLWTTISWSAEGCSTAGGMIASIRSASALALAVRSASLLASAARRSAIFRCSDATRSAAAFVAVPAAASDVSPPRAATPGLLSCGPPPPPGGGGGGGAAGIGPAEALAEASSAILRRLFASALEACCCARRCSWSLSIHSAPKTVQRSASCCVASVCVSGSKAYTPSRPASSTTVTSSTHHLRPLA